MRQQLLTFLLLGFTFFGYASDQLIGQILKLKPRDVVRQDIREKANTVFAKTIFNSASFEDLKKVEKLKNKTILKIELVFTKYKQNEDFDQNSLNKKRLKALFLAAPNSASQKGIEWGLIQQTGADSPEKGKEFFHGFIITYRDDASAVKIDIERDFILLMKEKKANAASYDLYLKNESKKRAAEFKEEEESLVNKDNGASTVVKKDTTDCRPKMPEYVGGNDALNKFFTENIKFPRGAPDRDVQVQCEFIVGENGKVIGVRFPNLKYQSEYADEVKRVVDKLQVFKPGSIDCKTKNFLLNFKVSFLSRGTILISPVDVFMEGKAPTAGTGAASNEIDYTTVKPTPASSQIGKGLQKVIVKSAILVVDVTASMTPYSSQMLEYLQSTASIGSPYTNVVLFNDGDGKPDRKKQTGKVGGIYHEKASSNTDKLIDRMADMMKTGGGDIPENNVEALLYAQQIGPEAEMLVMIADNYATPRDMSLLSSVNKPVYILICGGTIVNDAYLEIARATKGKIYYNGREYSNFDTMNEGDKVKIGAYNFVLKNSKFVLTLAE